jgi:hypothetical protein
MRTAVAEWRRPQMVCAGLRGRNGDVMTMQDHDVWSGAYKIPWDEPGFSQRMLAEHLSQEHDLASRRTEWIERQVAWIDTELLGGRRCRCSP